MFIRFGQFFAPPTAASISFRPASHRELEPLTESADLSAVGVSTRLRLDQSNPLITEFSVRTAVQVARVEWEDQND